MTSGRLWDMSCCTPQAPSGLRPAVPAGDEGAGWRSTARPAGVPTLTDILSVATLSSGMVPFCTPPAEGPATSPPGKARCERNHIHRIASIEGKRSALLDDRIVFEADQER